MVATLMVKAKNMAQPIMSIKKKHRTSIKTIIWMEAMETMNIKS